ncbi:MAG: TIR domain-containing protein [Opitutae bacterium]
MSETSKAVFLSYARDDAAAARRIAEALRASGLEVWFDENELRGGDAWDAKIRKQIDACSLFLPIISVHTQERSKGYFRLEWKLAVDQTHLLAEGVPFIAPVVVDDTKEADAVVPPEFMKVQWTRLPGALPTPQFVEQVKRLLNGEAKAQRSEVRGQGSEDRGQRTEVSPASPKSAVPGWMWGVLGVVLVGVAVGVVLLRQPVPTPPVAASASEPKPAAANPSPLTHNPEPAAVPAAAKSIAVLPFANMSEDKDSSFFADGMHEDILTNLAVIRDLRVTSRTSVMEYRGTTKKIRQIASELGVAYVLEGSVRRAGNKVRVTGQLINARTDEHIWAKSYDRDLTDIFAIQSELSQAIAAALSAALSPQEISLMENRPTTSLAAYDLFLKARVWDQGYDHQSSRAQVEQWLLEAVTLDPAFAQAWALLSSVHVYAYSGSEDSSPERLAQAKAAIETAVRLAPGDPVVIESQGGYYYHGFKDYAQAAVHYRRLLLLNPNSAIAYGQLGFLERRQGRWQEALDYIRKSVQLDPRNQVMAWEVGDALRDLRRYDEAVTAFRYATGIAPDNLYIAIEEPGVAFNARGSTREVDAWLAQTKPTAANSNQLLALRLEWAHRCGDYSTVVRINQQHPYLDTAAETRWGQDVNAVIGLVGHNELAAARTRAQQLIPELNALVEKQASNFQVWKGLAYLYAFTDDRESALRCANRMKALLPETVDAKIGPSLSLAYAQILAWTGDKDGALAELARLLRTPRGANVYTARFAVGWLPLRGDPRFEALLADPKNNEPLLMK